MQLREGTDSKRIQSLLDLIDGKRKVKLEVLLKCEPALRKVMDTENFMAQPILDSAAAILAHLGLLHSFFSSCHSPLTRKRTQAPSKS